MAEAFFGVRRKRGEGSIQRFDLDRIAQRRAGAVGLDVGDGSRIEAGALVGPHQQRGLRLRVRRGERIGAAAVVLGAAADDREDAVAVALGLVEPLQEHEADALAAAVAVGVGGEGLGAAVAGQHAGAGEALEGLGRQQAR